MALIACGECNHKISESAKSCPNCGWKIPPKTTLTTYVLGTVLGGGLLAAIVLPALQKVSAPQTTPQQLAAKQRSDDQLNAALAAAKIIKKHMRDPDSFVLTSALIIEGTGAACFSFRSKNGFGGYNAGNAVMDGISRKIKLSESDGFDRAWKTSCEGVKGFDAVVSIKWML